MLWSINTVWLMKNHAVRSYIQVKNADKSIIRLPRQDLNRLKEMAETSCFWARKYLIYTLFTPFDLGRNTTRKERTKDMIKILFVCWDTICR